MRMSRVAILGVLVVAFLPACSSDEEPVPELLPAGCPEAWQPVTPPLPGEITSPLAYADGNLYFGVQRGVISVPASGGAETVLSPAVASGVWVEGDHLILSGGQLGTQFHSLPLTGGTPALLVDGAAGRADSGIVQLHARLPTATDFFWAESSRLGLREPTTVWRAPRAGGPPAEIARFTELTASGDTALYFEGAALAPEGLVLGEDWGVAKVIPLDGGAARALAAPDVENPIGNIDFLGVDARGVYWSVTMQPTAVPPPREVVVSPADGGAPRPVWSGVPLFSSPVRAWPDGAGGLVVVGSQRFRDETGSRVTIWSIDANGGARRLACAPVGEYVDDQTPAIGPDAFYFLARLEGLRMQIVRIGRGGAGT
jgi:hypothetical protein